MKNLRRLNVLFFKLWILLSILFGAMAVLSLFVAPMVITKWIVLCLVCSLIGVVIGVLFKQTSIE